MLYIDLSLHSRQHLASPQPHALNVDVKARSKVGLRHVLNRPEAPYAWYIHIYKYTYMSSMAAKHPMPDICICTYMSSMTSKRPMPGVYIYIYIHKCPQ